MYIMKLVKLFYSLLVKASLLGAAVAELYTLHEFQIFDDVSPDLFLKISVLELNKATT